MYNSDIALGSMAELDAVNEMLAAIGEPPVTTLDEELNSDVANARRILNRVNRLVQTKGWTFNIFEGLTIVGDQTTGLIQFKPTYLSLMGAGGTSTYTNRGGWVFDRVAQTDILFSIQANLIELKDYDEMPACFRQWIVTKAARQFNSRFFGAPEVDGVLQQEEADAYQTCQEYEMDYGKFNMLDGDAFVQGLLTR